MTDINPTPSWANVRQLETNEFATGGSNGNMNEQAKSLAARSELLKQYAALPYESKTGGYALNELVQLTTGDIVRSTIPSNVNNPNENMTGWVNPIEKSLLFDNFGVTSPSQIKDYLSTGAIYAKIRTDGVDQTDIFKAYVFASKTLKRMLILPAGTILISDTITIDFTSYMCGAGRDVTLIQFKNSTQDKVCFDFKRGATKGWWSDLSIRSETFGVGIGVRMSDSRTDVGSPVWKNTFCNVEISGFALSHTYTSEQPLSGGTHAHCSENLWLHSRFVNNKVTCLIQNCQAVNNFYLHCDFENFDTSYINGQTVYDDNFEFFIDEAGGGISIIDASWIGRGRWFGWRYPLGGNTLFAGSQQFNVNTVRAELRTPHIGVLFEELIHGVDGTLFTDIAIQNSATINFGAAIDLLRYGGRLKFSATNVKPAGGAGSFTVRQFPTLGRTASGSINQGSMSSVYIDRCGKIEYVRETTSPYGQYNRNATGRVEITRSDTSSTNLSTSSDTYGFVKLSYGGDIKQLGYGLCTYSPFSKLIYNADGVSSGFIANSQIKIIMPRNARPLKFFTYKHAQRLSNDTPFNLYIVKDVANWATSTFNKDTDAFLISSITAGVTTGKAGYFESTITIPTSTMGVENMAGYGNWLDGRIMIEYLGSVAYAGFIGIEYI